MRQAKNKKKHKGLRILLIILLALLVLLGGTATYVIITLSGHIKNLQRVDHDGVLYYAEYVGKYENNLIELPLNFVRAGGCSAFLTQNENGDVITGRNYDLAHLDFDGNPTGLNVVLRMNPEGKYSSINVADAAWVSVLKVPYVKGALDEGKTTHLFLAFLPYLCMDGINEKGLTASILALDVKEGETAVYQDTPGLPVTSITQLLRSALDNCATVDEVVEFARNHNMRNIVKRDYHLFVSDAGGTSAVLEWRNNELIVTYTDAVTNFYVGCDDAEDVYVDGSLKEKFPGPVRSLRDYHYGYGHGFNRFNTIVQQLDKHRIDSTSYMSEMSEQDAMKLLGSVAQNYDKNEVTSFTQYSEIFNNTEKTLIISIMQDYANEYGFSFEK
ncbi:MAG: linear amide C-N hydrolase [Lachnospiraceae bacterium]|nr:linear amide C-N hydrolase [Lachnospiraceae bacterium]